MSLWDKLFSRKESAARIVSVQNVVGRPMPTPANYESFAVKGYGKNAVAYSCIHKIAQAAAGVEWQVFRKRKGGEPVPLLEHPLLKLIERPNPMMATSTFFENVMAYLQLSGNTYIEAFRPTPSQPPMEIWPVRPDRMTIIPGANGFPEAYRYTFGGVSKLWPVDFVKLSSDILHVKTFNPVNDWYGMSPMQAALLSLDQNNSASIWNLGMLQNSATPSGVMRVDVTDANPTGSLNDEQYERIKEEIDNRYSGPKNAGRPMLLEGGLSWSQMSLSPKDMEFLKGKEVTSSDIAMVYGVPLEILGLGQKTFTNFKEARLSFYEDTVLPSLDHIKTELNRWLSPAFGDDVFLDYNRDGIEALAIKRDSKFTSLSAVNFLTQNEKREETGFKPIDGMDVFVVGNQIIDPEAEEEPIEPVIPDVEDDEDEIETIELEEDESEKSFKSFNNINANERRKSWRRQNARRNRLEKTFIRDLNEDFGELTKAMITAGLDIADQKLAEFEMLKAAEEFTETIEKTISKHIKFTLEDFGNLVLEEGKSVFNIIETKANTRYTSFILDYVKQRTGEAIVSITNSTQRQIKKILQRLLKLNLEEGLSNEELTILIAQEFDGLSKNRARVIARTEVQLAAQTGTREAVKSLQVPGMRKEWVPVSPDGRNRDGSHGPDHLAMAGQVIDMDEKFDVPPGVQMEGPGDKSAPADQVIQCRCVLVYKAPTTNEGI